MDPSEYEIMYAVEDSHWWYRGMETITRAVLQRWYRPGNHLRILDAGCGTGAAMSSYLRDYGNVTGIDISNIALTFCRKRTTSNLSRASVERLPFRAQSFDLVTSFDVLYEQAVCNEGDAVKEIARVLIPGGRIFLRLPAYDWLRGQHDAVIHTARRYTTGQVRALLKQNGFAVEHLSYSNMFLFPFALLKRTYERLLPPARQQSDLGTSAGPFNPLLRRILATEAHIVARNRLPFGLSVVAVGQKI
jgi:ubiquinone/menaquinone biosynthesis C-methylase UbiE